MRLLRPLARAARAGFTLIELLTVILIIGILMAFLLPKIPEAIDSAKVTACKKNMSEIYSGFIMYQQKFDGKMPHESGVRFFAELISMGVFENTKKSVTKLNCPNVQDPPGTVGMPETEWYKDLTPIDGSWSSYAGRDCKRAPLKVLSGKEALVADDNDGSMNHRTATVVLYGDGSAQTFETEVLRTKEGKLQEGEYLIVGPDSQVEDLRKLSLD